MPTRAGGRCCDVAFDRAHDRGDAPRVELRDGSGERRLGGTACGAARFRVQMVDGVGTEVDQVAARGLESGEEIFAGGAIDCDKRIAHGAVEAGVGLVEESSRGGWGFANEKQSHGGGCAT